MLSAPAERLPTEEGPPKSPCPPGNSPESGTAAAAQHRLRSPQQLKHPRLSRAGAAAAVLAPPSLPGREGEGTSAAPTSLPPPTEPKPVPMQTRERRSGRSRGSHRRPARRERAGPGGRDTAAKSRERVCRAARTARSNSDEILNITSAALPSASPHSAAGESQGETEPEGERSSLKTSEEQGDSTDSEPELANTESENTHSSSLIPKTAA